MINRFTSTIFVIITLFCITGSATAQGGGYPPSWYLWMRESWTGNGEPYRKIQQEIDYAFARRQIGLNHILSYKEQAVKSPPNPLNVFRWGYATVRFAATSQSEKDTGDAINGLDYYFAQTPSPRVYEYSRVRFLVYARLSHTFGQQLSNVGERLLFRNRKDLSVKFWLTKILGNSPYESDRALSLRLNQELVKEYPKKASVHALLADQFFDRWLGARQKKQNGKYFADKSIAAYRQYLKLAPPNPVTRRRINARIKRMKTE